MEYGIISKNPDNLATDCLIVAIGEDGKLSPSAKYIDDVSSGHLKKILKHGDMTGKINSSLLLHQVPNIKAKRLLLIGAGDLKKLDAKQFSEICHAACQQLLKTKAQNAAIYFSELALAERDDSWKLRQLGTAICTSLYQYDHTKSVKAKPRSLKKCSFACPTDLTERSAKKALSQGLAIAKGMNLTRELGNLPANVCTPSYLANQAKQLAKKHSKVTCQVLDEKAMQKLKMGSLLSVSRGSAEPARLIVLQYKGASAKKAPIALVGKGITFDSGGISLKPGPKMDEMKYDMCGAASVIGTFQAVADMQLPINLVTIVAASENLPSGTATKPGDIVTSMSGQTIEILNTDAEGRLVLCDALTYCERFKPSFVIDVATLTGAIIVALGYRTTGLMSNDEGLSEALINAGQHSLDRVWPLPIWEDYQSDLDSPFADIANIGVGGAGSITAGCFLARFSKKFRWAHLDIAGTAWQSGKNKSATGRPVPLLTQFIMDQCR